jgi:actin-related protein
LNVEHPCDIDFINWSCWERIWFHSYFDKLRVEATEHPVLLTEPPRYCTSNKKQLMELMFELFDVPAIQTSVPGLLSLFASGRTTGVVMDIGYKYSHAIAVQDGVPVSINTSEVGGANITDCLQTLIGSKSINDIFGNTRTIMKEKIMSDMKEKLCLMIPKDDYGTENYRQLYTLPDGNKLYLDHERYRCCELLFNPSLIHLSYPGIQSLVLNSIRVCDSHIRSSLYNNIILEGGSSKIDGMLDRFRVELKELNSAQKMTIVQNHNKNAWIGGSMIASLSSFDVRSSLRITNY